MLPSEVLLSLCLGVFGVLVLVGVLFGYVLLGLDR